MVKERGISDEKTNFSIHGSSYRIDNHGGGVDQVNAAFDENLQTYTLDAVVVEADRTKNQFGDTITEQSYYRTGGDVKVITREEIEKRHYTDMTEAIKRIPGVSFSNPGYRGGQYTYATYQNTMSINGDSRVVVLVDGRRVDNPTSANMGSTSSEAKTLVDLNQLVSMEDVDKIEVIKGPGASVYGADATGGVINIITRKGGIDNVGTIDLSTGSWNKHVYNISYSGSAGDDKSLHYFISATRQMAGDSKYHDGLTDKDYTYKGTAYKEDGFSFRIDKDFGNNRDLKIWYNHQNGKDGYPITAPDYRYWSQAGWDATIQKWLDLGKRGGAAGNPGYRNLFALDALSGSYNAYRNNDIDVSYTFNKDNGMESFVRVYSQKHHYWGIDRYPYWVAGDGSFVPFPGSAGWNDFIENWHPDGWDDLTGIFNEENRGIQVQYGKSIGKHDLLGSLTYDKAKMYTLNDYGTVENTHVERKSWYGYVQDKIHINDKWDFTPALRYVHYSAFGGTYDGDRYTDKGSSASKFTPAINTEYAFNDSMSAYFGWTQVYRPLKQSDYESTTPNGKALEDEKGNAWTIGFRKDFGENTELTIHYDWTEMSNTVVGYPVWDAKRNRFRDKAVNAKETKKSFNITFDHKFDDHWNLGLAYTHFDDKYTAKDGMDFDPDLLNFGATSNVNLMINSLRPENHYTANLSYENGKWYSGLLVNWYTGMNPTAFTSSRALVLDWNLNYDITKELTTYVTITNLTNEAYENAYSAYNGIGAAPQPGRAYMIGARYKF